VYLIFLLQYRVDWGFFDRMSTVTGVSNKLAQLGYHGSVKLLRKLLMGHWALGIGHWALGIGHGELDTERSRSAEISKGILPSS
jgi:hypothetical protein